MLRTIFLHFFAGLLMNDLRVCLSLNFQLIIFSKNISLTFTILKLKFLNFSITILIITHGFSFKKPNYYEHWKHIIY